MTGPFGIGLMAFAASATVATATSGRISANELQNRPTLELAERLLGGPAPEIVEATTIWHPGVAQYSAVTAYFAPRAEPTAWNGLCRIEMRSVWLDFVEPRYPETILTIEAPRRATYYRLIGPEPPTVPGRGTAASTPCATLPGAFAGEQWAAAYIKRGERVADADEAAFAYRAFALARRARTIDDDQCFSADEARCRDVRQFLRNLDLREVWGLRIEPCRHRTAFLCVAGHVGATHYGAYLAIEVETGSRDIGAPRDPVRVRGIRMVSQMQPVA